ncbi:MAG: hypothetical protein J6U99_01085, partial [Rikenellaceae bacterium]|nr:hypothetical protein [Rikenellaceae bacterium]
MKILRLNGTDKKLYALVAPLVMNPAVIRQNNNYPYKTSSKYMWHLMVEKDEVIGFIPLKPTLNGYCINNYYYKLDTPEIFEQLLDDVLEAGYDELTATAHKRDVDAFTKRGFTVLSQLSKYTKLIKTK